ATSSEFSLWKHPGPEVRLTRFGILGMPHAWLLLAAGIGAVLSLTLDARRRSALTVLPLWISLPAGIGAATISLYMLLWLILGRLELAPAPLLVFGIIALELGSRFWRWISLFILVACILWYANLLRFQFQLGLSSSASLKLFDSIYNLPRLLPVTTLSVGSALSLLLLLMVLLGRQKPAS